MRAVRFLGVCAAAVALVSGGLTASAATSADATIPRTQFLRSPSDACGQQPQKSDGTYWSCTFDDEFTGNRLDRTKWVPQTRFVTGTGDHVACYLDDPGNVAVSWGNLRLSVKPARKPIDCATPPGSTTTATYSAGMVTTHQLFSQKYGRFEARMKATWTNVPGLQEDFWLWPDDRVPSSTEWPAAGEMDVAELYSRYPTLAVPFLHYSADAEGPQPGINTAWNCVARRGVYNTYTLEWSPTTVTIYVNGKTCLVNTSADPAFQKPYILALTEALGVGDNAATARTRRTATLAVDYVRAWK